MHGISLAGAPGETGQLPDRTSREVTADHGERSVQAGGEVKVTASDGGRGAQRRVVHGYRPGTGQRARRDARETALCRCRRVLKPADRIGGRRCCYRGSGAGEQCRRSGQDRDHPSMPAHDLPYFEPAGGQNAEASSVVKAFGLARSRETALPAAYRCGRAPLAGCHAPPGARARCLAAGPGRPGTGGPLRGTGRGPAAIWRERPRPGLGPSGSVSCRTVPLLVRACPALGSLRYQGPRDLTGRPGRRRSCRHGRREWLAGRSVPRCG